MVELLVVFGRLECTVIDSFLKRVISYSANETSSVDCESSTRNIL